MLSRTEEELSNKLSFHKPSEINNWITVSLQEEVKPIPESKYLSVLISHLSKCDNNMSQTT